MLACNRLVWAKRTTKNAWVVYLLSLGKHKLYASVLHRVHWCILWFTPDIISGFFYTFWQKIDVIKQPFVTINAPEKNTPCIFSGIKIRIIRGPLQKRYVFVQKPSFCHCSTAVRWVVLRKSPRKRKFLIEWQQGIFKSLDILRSILLPRRKKSADFVFPAEQA